MDVVSPELIWVDGKCFRINDSGDHQRQEEEEEMYSQDDNVSAAADDEYDENEQDLQYVDFYSQDGGSTKAMFHVASAYFGQIIGAKGVTLKRIMNETGTDVKLPRRGVKGDVVVIGDNKQKVIKAVRRINMIVMAARQKQRITHFMSVPMNSPEVIESFLKFKEEILANPPQGVTEDLFTQPQKLHLTLTVMALMDEEERDIIIKALEESKTTVVDALFKGKPLEVTVSGVSYMNDDPKKTNVLYAEIHEDGTLLNLAEQLISLISKEGFSSSRNSIKFHITLMNSSNRKSDDDDDDGRFKKRIPFDGSHILEKYKEYNFGKCTVTEIHCSRVHSADETGYYQSSIMLKI